MRYLPIKTVLIGAVEGGRVENKVLEDGVIVKAGDRILELSNPDLQLNYLNQEATIVQQINQIRQNSSDDGAAKSQFKRDRS